MDEDEHRSSSRRCHLLWLARSSLLLLSGELVLVLGLGPLDLGLDGCPPSLRLFHHGSELRSGSSGLTPPSGSGSRFAGCWSGLSLDGCWSGLVLDGSWTGPGLVLASGAVRGTHPSCLPYQESDPQVIERQCQKMDGRRIDCCFLGNRREHRSRDGVIKRGEERE